MTVYPNFMEFFPFQLLNDYLRERTPLTRSTKRNFSNQSTGSGHSSVVTSPDYLEQGTPAGVGMSNTLQPVATFLEHAQINSANSQQQLTEGQAVSGDLDSEKNLSERLKRVVNTLLQLRETIGHKAIRHLKETFEGALQGNNRNTVFNIWLERKFQ